MLRRVMRLELEIDWRRVIPVVACVALAAALPVYLPLLLGRVIDASLGGAGLAELMPMLILIVLVAVVSAFAEGSASLFGARIGYGLSWRLARRLYGHLLRMPMLSYATINPGVLNSRLTNDMRLVDPLFATVPMALLQGWVGLIAVAVALATINIWFLLAFCLVPLALLTVRFAEGRINQTIADAYEVNTAAAAQIEATTNGDAISLVRQSAATRVEEARYGAIADRSVQIAARMDSWKAMVEIAYRLCFDLITALFLGIGVYLASTGQISIGSVVSALFFVGLVRGPLGEVVGQRYPLIRARMGLDRVEAVLTSPNTGLATIAATAKAPAPEVSKSPLVFDRVSYAYPARKDVIVETLSDVASASSATSGFLSGVALTALKSEEGSHDAAQGPAALLSDISFSIAAGETVAVAGHSGSGKSTIINLACGIVRPDAGKVSLCGHDTRTMTEEDIWSFASLVSQDVYLRDATLRDNLCQGMEDVGDEALTAALHNAGLETVLRALPDGLDTMVGQRGKRFSGGERQRIAIARAVLRDRPVLILDEATSHLDSARESSVLDTIADLSARKAVLVVAHRLTSLERADRVIMIEEGSVAESGAHADLIGSNGPYSKLHNT